MSTLKRKEREKLQRRNSILSAARDLFYRKGYQTTTMEEIAEKAELSKGTLYLYFRSKDELYISIIEEGFYELEEKLTQATKRKRNVEQKIRAIYYTFIQHCLDNPEYFRITQYFLSGYARENISPQLQQRINHLSIKLLDYASQAIREGIDSGLFKKELNPFNLSVIGWRLATGLLDLALVDGLGEEVETEQALFEEAISLMIEGAKRRS